MKLGGLFRQCVERDWIQHPHADEWANVSITAVDNDAHVLARRSRHCELINVTQNIDWFSGHRITDSQCGAHMLRPRVNGLHCKTVGTTLTKRPRVAGNLNGVPTGGRQVDTPRLPVLQGVCRGRSEHDHTVIAEARRRGHPKLKST